MPERRKSRSRGSSRKHSRRHSRKHSRRNSRKYSAKELDVKIIEKLKRGADDMLESLWNHSDRQAHKMELNIKQLADFNGSRIQLELDAMPGLSKLLRRRGIDAHHLLTTYFKLMASCRQTRMGLYMTGGTLECEAVIKGLYKDALRHMKRHSKADEAAARTTKTTKTARTWTSVAGGKSAVTARTEQAATAATAATVISRKLHPSEAPSEAVSAEKSATRQEKLNPVVTSAIKTAQREADKARTFEEDVKTYVSVLPSDSISRVVNSRAPAPSRATRSSHALEGGLTKNALRRLQETAVSKKSTSPQLRTPTVQEREEEEEGFQEPAPVSKSAVTSRRSSRGELSNPSLRVARAPSVFPSSVSLRTPSAALVPSAKETGYKASPPSTLRTHRPPHPAGSSISRNSGEKYFIKAVERAPDGSRVSRLEGGVDTEFFHKSSQRIRAGLQHAVSPQQEEAADPAYRFVEPSSRVTARTQRTTAAK